MSIFLIILYMVSMVSSLVVLLLDFRVSKKILVREGEFNSKVNHLNTSIQSNKKTIVELETKVNNLENLLKSLEAKVKELEEKNNKNPTIKTSKPNNKKDNVSKKPIQKKVVLRKVYKNTNDDKTEATAEPQSKKTNTPLETV